MKRNFFRNEWFAAAVALFAAAPAIAEESPNPFAKIGHIVVIYTENRSFDHVFGLFPGADGLSTARGHGFRQVDADGSILSGLPAPAGDERLPAVLPNAPFPLDAFMRPSDKTADPTHDFYQEQEQINDGRMDRFVAASNVGGLTMGYYDGRKLKQWALAREFTLADHFFHAAFGGSFLNHIYLACACAPTIPPDYRDEARAKLIAIVDEKTGFLKRAANSPKSALEGPPKFERAGRLTKEFDAVSTMQPFWRVNDKDESTEVSRLPPQKAPTIGDRLDAKKVSWAWFSGGYDAIVAGRIAPYAAPEYFQSHHQPYLYFDSFAPGTQKRNDYLKDADAFFALAAAGNLPAVSFYKPVGRVNEHSHYSDLAAGDEHIAETIEKLRQSPNWSDMLIIVTADENGGYFDHVAPPRIDRFGPGTRVPTLLISPFVRKGFVDHTVYDTTSILRTIEARFGLDPLTRRDRTAADFRNALQP
jgi:acid phosphatase